MDYTELFCDMAKKAGITRLLFHIEDIEKQAIEIFEHRPESIELARQTLVFIEGEYGGQSGTAFTEDLSAASIPFLIDAIKQTAQANATPFAPTPITPGGTAGDYTHPQAEALRQMLLSAEQAIYDTDARIYSAVVEFSSQHKRITLQNESGDAMQDGFGNLYLQTSAMARQQGSVQTAMSVHLAGGMFDLEAQALRDATTASGMLGSGPCPGGVYPAVLDAGVFSAMLGVYLPAFFAQRAQQGTSLLKGKTGTQVANPIINLCEQPCGIIRRSFDDEGTPTAQKHIIQNGVLQTLLHNRQTAKAGGAASTGNGFRPMYSAAVATAATNLQLQCGASSGSALLGTMCNGLYICECDGMFAGANPVSGDFALISKGYLVKNGAIGQPVSRITIGGNFFELLNRIEALGDTWATTHDPFANVVQAPAVLVQALRVAGS